MISPSVVTLGLSATAKPVAILLSKIAVTLFPGIFCRDLLTLDSRWFTSLFSTEIRRIIAKEVFSFVGAKRGLKIFHSIVNVSALLSS